MEVPSLKRDLKWEFVPTVQVGDEVAEGDVFGTVTGDDRCTAEDHGSVRSEGKVKEDQIR